MSLIIVEHVTGSNYWLRIAGETLTNDEALNLAAYIEQHVKTNRRRLDPDHTTSDMPELCQVCGCRPSACCGH